MRSLYEKKKSKQINALFISSKILFDEQPEDADYNPLPEDRPGGFEWGNQGQDNPPPDPDNHNQNNP